MADPQIQLGQRPKTRSTIALPSAHGPAVRTALYWYHSPGWRIRSARATPLAPLAGVTDEGAGETHCPTLKPGHRRKQEGAVYTPAFITRYLVEQALADPGVELLVPELGGNGRRVQGDIRAADADLALEQADLRGRAGTGFLAVLDLSVGSADVLAATLPPRLMPILP